MNKKIKAKLLSVLFMLSGLIGTINTTKVCASSELGDLKLEDSDDSDDEDIAFLLHWRYGRRFTPPDFSLEVHWIEFASQIQELIEAIKKDSLKNFEEVSKLVYEQFKDHGSISTLCDVICERSSKTESNSILHLAVLERKESFVKYIVKNCIVSLNKNDDGKTPLDLARDNGDENIIKDLENSQKLDELRRSILNRTDIDGTLRDIPPDMINAKDGDGDTLLHLALDKKNYDIAKWLIEDKGADVNAQDRQGNTPLAYIIATMCCDRERTEPIMKLLLEKGGTISPSGTLFACAHRQILEQLDWELKCNCNNITAVLEHFLATFNNLIEQGAIKQDELAELVMKSVCYNKVEEKLMGLITNIDKSGEFKILLLKSAVKFNKWEYVKLLIENGVDVNTRLDDCNFTVLMQAVWRSNKEETVSWLINHGAEVNATDSYGRTALDLALECNRLDIVELLKQHGGIAKEH